MKNKSELEKDALLLGFRKRQQAQEHISIPWANIAAFAAWAVAIFLTIWAARVFADWMIVKGWI